ncbi:hypothetical protein SK128_025319 [Halocaridina rubra]|uniref:Uncharacterized protein n=1 Tax=Halocaridina rubra TaxID=373956 RepID=A0AAN8WUQ1_HALRR
MSQPNEAHFNAAKRVLKYLKELRPLRQLGCLSSSKTPNSNQQFTLTSKPRMLSSSEEILVDVNPRVGRDSSMLVNWDVCPNSLILRCDHF